MSLIPRHSFSMNGWTAGLTLLGVALVSAAGVALAVKDIPAAWRPVPVRAAVRKSSAALPERSALPLENWSVFRIDGNTGRETAGSLNSRFRLSGTYRVYQTDGMARKAVLSDLSRTNQVIVATGDSLGDGIVVKTIDETRVELSQGESICELELRLSRNGATNEAGTLQGGALEDTRGYEVLRRGKFGLQVADDRWLFERKNILDYYNTVLEDADRLVALFDSLKPLYDDTRKITGYILIPEGEKDFFEEVGLKEGDVMRKVNSMPLMNRRVAEGFIREFASGQMTVCVLEVERAGVSTKLVYELR